MQLVLSYDETTENTVRKLTFYTAADWPSSSLHTFVVQQNNQFKAKLSESELCLKFSVFVLPLVLCHFTHHTSVQRHWPRSHTI